MSYCEEFETNPNYRTNEDNLFALKQYSKKHQQFPSSGHSGSKQSTAANDIMQPYRSVCKLASDEQQN
jgi:hypothetical protein